MRNRIFFNGIKNYSRKKFFFNYSKIFFLIFCIINCGFVKYLYVQMIMDIYKLDIEFYDKNFVLCNYLILNVSNLK